MKFNNDINLVIMAGGKGERLRPLTKKMPKPLIDINGNCLLELILCYFKKYKFTEAILSINYKKNFFRKVLKENNFYEFKLKFFAEHQPLGSIGSLSSIQYNSNRNVILVYNGDILTNLNLNSFISSFYKESVDLLIATRYCFFSVPYGLINADNNKNVTKLIEKPNFSYLFNAGIYIMRKKIIGLMPKNQFFEINDLVELLIKQGKKVKYFPILDYWIDIGTMQDLARLQNDIQYLNFKIN